MKKFLIFDVDHTISTFDHEAGMRMLEEHLREKFGNDLAQGVCRFVDRCYAAFYARARGKKTEGTQKLEQLIKYAARSIEGLDNFSDIHWSRELWIQLAAEAWGGLSARSTCEAAGYFWKGVKQATEFYPDADEFFKRLIVDNISKPTAEKPRLVFVSSSDARLLPNTENTKLVYSPQDSKAMKFARMSFRKISYKPMYAFIGDPVSKPHPEFWQKVLQRIGYTQGEDLAIMTGDSPRSDLTGLDKFGIIPVLIDREGNFTPPEVPHVKYVISSLEALQNIMGIEYLNRKEGFERRK